MFDLTGKTALVTGASNGIGKGVAVCLAKAGADIIVNYRSDEKGAGHTAEQIRAYGRKTLEIRADVSDNGDVRRMFEEIRQEFGRLDILINNAGTSRAEDIFEITEESWDNLIRTNLTSGFLCAKEAMELMRNQRSGRIIQISSVVAHQGAVKGHLHYAATKAGQLGLTKTLARTGAPFGITVNAIAPGIIRTELLMKTHGEAGVRKLAEGVPMGLGETADIGNAAVFLCSEEASYITGITLDVNGGQDIR